MKLTERERADRREAFRHMSAAQKADYIFSYYKLPIVLTLLFAYILGYGLYRHFSRKEVLLYVACANVAVSDETAEALSEEFVRRAGMDTRKYRVALYRNLYLSETPSLANHQYAYASRLKLLAAADAGQLDVILMNREAYDSLSGGGYLAELASSLSRNDPALYERLQPRLTENEVVLEDNSLALALGETEHYRAVTAREQNALDISQAPVLTDAGFTDSVFLGLAPNSPRIAAATEYIAYLESFLPEGAADNGG